MLTAYLSDLWQILLELAPSLLLGLFIAGLMHVYLPVDFIYRGLSRPNLASVTRATLLGVPLPLCSCGVIPTALGLRREGASPGATTAFMISTPQTGVDSVLVSAAFLGWPFAIFKVVAAFITGLFGGVLTNHWVKADNDKRFAHRSDDEQRRREGLAGAVRYAIVDLLGAIDLWLIGGVLAAALVTTLTPPDFFASQTWAQGMLGLLVVLAISLPLYVCTTASVPIAASLLAAGLPAGSALVFLMAGPATNVATVGAVYRTLGGRVLGIYLGTVVVMSLGLAVVFDALWDISGADIVGDEHGGSWLGTLSALVLLALLGWLLLRRLRARQAPEPETASGGLTLQVHGMTCAHCVASVKQALEQVDGVDAASPDLGTGRVLIRGGHLDASALAHAVEGAGFQVKT
jgi:uncharacterized membrane protein YraQ (UPF0718 family)/copper chaperone CopZ